MDQTIYCSDPTNRTKELIDCPLSEGTTNYQVKSSTKIFITLAYTVRYYTWIPSRSNVERKRIGSPNPVVVSARISRQRVPLLTSSCVKNLGRSYEDLGLE